MTTTTTRTPNATIERREAAVRSYCRDFPVVFTRAQGSRLWDEDGREYLDFFAGAGALNYGHNDADMKAALIAYLEADGPAHTLDMTTEAKVAFLESFENRILTPRNLDYRVMFPGPTGTNCVESALKLARKITGRHSVISFTHAFHGMTLGALAVTGNAFKRSGAGVPLGHAVVMPYAGYIEDGADTISLMERMLSDDGSGIDLPAAVIVECVQGEGGLNVASATWLARLSDMCTRLGILLIVDDIQAGCGRTGTFFSFEPAGIQPDIVCLSKSIGGYGLPMAITLLKPEHDAFEPGEHNGTFRGNNLAFVAARVALEKYWSDATLARSVLRKADVVTARLNAMAAAHPALKAEVKGRGLMQGLSCDVPGLAKAICHAAFQRGLIIETAGPESEVAKVFPALTIEIADLERGLDILADAACEVLARGKSNARAAA